MFFFYLVLGLIPSVVNGWFFLGTLQYKKRVLYKFEQITMGLVLGLTSTMLAMFCAHAYGKLPLILGTYMGVQIVLAVILIGLYFFLARHTPAPSPLATSIAPKWLKITLWTFIGWVILKALVAGIVFLALTPTYLDDTLDNWNLRGKLYYVDHALTLAMPSEDPVASVKGVSSYPPAVPLMKAMLASVAHDWNDALVNSIHIVWYIGALVLLYYVLRRMTSKEWALLGVILLGGMPLYLMHGTNPYADAFMSVHVFIAVSLTYLGLREADPSSRMSYFRLGSFASALLPFTKNEGLVIYLPPLLLILCLGLIWLWHKKKITLREVMTILLTYAIPIAILSLPWLIFKWSHGLTFGNAKTLSSLGIGWQPGVVTAIVVNTFMEGNWLLLFPLIIILFVWRRRSAFTTFLPLSAFFLIVFIGQLLLFMFTGLAAEARMQTGLARGVVQQLPVIILIVSLLLADAKESLIAGYEALVINPKKSDRSA